jgi:hypothetical protein
MEPQTSTVGTTPAHATKTEHTTKTAYEMLVDEAESAHILNIALEEGLIATSEDITILWRYFRITDDDSVAAHGLPVTNNGETISAVFALRESQQIQYDILLPHFRQFALDPSIKLMRIETPIGGLFIRKTGSLEPGAHKFMTADLQADSSICMTMIAFMAVSTA